MIGLAKRAQPGLAVPQKILGDNPLPTSSLFELYVWEVFLYDGLQFAPDHVGRESRTQQAAVQGRHFSVVNLATVGAELAFDALADHRALIGLPRCFFHGRIDMPVGNSPRAQVS